MVILCLFGNFVIILMSVIIPCNWLKFLNQPSYFLIGWNFEIIFDISNQSSYIVLWRNMQFYLLSRCMYRMYMKITFVNIFLKYKSWVMVLVVYMWLQSHIWGGAVMWCYRKWRHRGLIESDVTGIHVEVTWPEVDSAHAQKVHSRAFFLLL